jgi:hypothetical protein
MLIAHEFANTDAFDQMAKLYLSSFQVVGLLNNMIFVRHFPTTSSCLVCSFFLYPQLYVFLQGPQELTEETAQETTNYRGCERTTTYRRTSDICCLVREHRTPDTAAQDSVTRCSRSAERFAMCLDSWRYSWTNCSNTRTWNLVACAEEIASMVCFR